MSCVVCGKRAAVFEDDCMECVRTMHLCAECYRDPQMCSRCGLGEETRETPAEMRAEEQYANWRGK